MPNAKFLWQRIPAPVKTASPELVAIWKVGEALWKREFPAVYVAAGAQEWADEEVRRLMAEVKRRTQTRALHLISQAYSSIKADELAAFIGQDTAEAIETITKLGWQADAPTRLVTPKKIPCAAQQPLPSGQQLSRLTDYISFLEN